MGHKDRMSNPTRALIHVRLPRQFLIAFVLCLLAGALARGENPDRQNLWMAGPPLLGPTVAGHFDSIAVKDPSIVFFDGNWHLFYTARGDNEYTTGYVRAPHLKQLQDAPRYQLPQVRGKNRYGCAPQIFYFTPEQKWYLLFQNRDANYQPAYSCNRDITDLQGWSAPQPLLAKDSPEKWIDFWVICDDVYAYLFYTEAHRRVMVRSTKLKHFPHDWGAAKEVFQDVHEAVHVYKVKGLNAYHMIYEQSTPKGRCYGLAFADHPLGPWRKVTDRYATGDQLRYPETAEKWTEMVSHGEAIRCGYDERLEYDPADGRWLIQGILQADSHAPYPTLPWQLGIIEKLSNHGKKKPGPKK